MSIINDYLAQTVIWKRETDRNQFNEIEYSETEISVRWEPRLTRVRNADGVEVTASARVYTTDPVSIGDTLVGPDGRAWPVITVSQPTMLGGSESHREVMV